MHCITYFKILPVGSFLVIEYFKIAMYCDGPRAIMDVALYEILVYSNKTDNFLQIIVIIIINCYIIYRSTKKCPCPN